MSATPRIRTLVVDDSAFARKVLREALSGDPRIEVVGTARDGLEALERISEHSPDVVTLDLLMPNLDGLGVLAALPKVGGPRVIVVTTSESESQRVIDALSAGAFDFVHKPTALATDRLFELSEELREKVVLAGTTRPRAKQGERDRASSVPPPARAEARVTPVPLGTSQHGNIDAVVIGTSTGGPQALTRIIPALPRDLPVPVLVALHIPAGYTEALAQRLNEMSAVQVVEAEHTAIELGAGKVVIARGGEHLALARRGTQLFAITDTFVRGAAYSPSVDHLFTSAARELRSGVLGVVLTGMGNDGLEGARAIRREGGVVLAESASTSIVHGMPRAVSEALLATEEAPLDAMAERICSYVG